MLGNTREKGAEAEKDRQLVVPINKAHPHELGGILAALCPFLTVQRAGRCGGGPARSSNGKAL